MSSSSSKPRPRFPEEAPRSWLPWLLAPLVAVLAFGLGRCLPGLPAPDEHAGHEGETQGEGEAEVWTCSMHPQVRQPSPGACPLCGMDLIPLSALGEVDGDRVELSDRAVALARIQTVAVERIATPGVDVRLLGRVEVDESRVRNVSAWVGGRVDKLDVRETGVVVKRGQVIASLYSPEIYAAHQDLLTAARQVKKLAGASDLARGASESALAAARERLSLLGVPEAEIERMAAADGPRKSVAIRTDYGGTVMERQVTQGQYVDTGAVLYRIADLSQLWVQLDAYETDLPALVEGQTVELEVEALPGEGFSGEVSFIDPLVDPRRRVAKIRVEVQNPDGKLRPGMFVEAVVRGQVRGGDGSLARQKPLVIPVSAPLFTGKRSLVYVELPDTERPTYEPRVVDLGPRMGEQYPVVAGLSEGERVVVHGAFVIDADLQIRGGSSMMGQPDDDEAASDQLARVEPDAELRAGLAVVLSAYLDMQVALADDDWNAGKAAAARLVTAAEAVKTPGPGPAEDAWATLGAHLVHRAQEAADSEAIEGARGAFLQLSGLTKELLEVFGNPLETPVRLAFCPMANSNSGAEWIQAGTVVDNSYFGESMLSCGELRATVEAGQYLLAGGQPR